MFVRLFSYFGHNGNSYVLFKGLELFGIGVKLFPSALGNVTKPTQTIPAEEDVGNLANNAVSVLLCVAVSPRMVVAVREKAITMSMKWLLGDDICMAANVEVCVDDLLVFSFMVFKLILLYSYYFFLHFFLYDMPCRFILRGTM